MAHQTLWSVVRDSENLQLITTKAPVNLPPVDFLVVEGYIPDVPNILCVKDPYDLEAITPFTLAAVSLSGIPNTKRPDELKNVINRLVGEIAAYRQHDVKRLLAFSSTAQVGYMVLGIFSGSPLDLWAAYYIFLGTD